MPSCIRILGLAGAFCGACAASLIAPGTYLIEGVTTANRTETARSAKSPDAQQSMRAEVALIDGGAELGPTDVISTTKPIAGRLLQLHLESSAVTARRKGRPQL